MERLQLKFLTLFPVAHIEGVDLSPVMISFAERRFPSSCFPHLSFHQLAHSAQNEKYNLILSFCVFHLISNPVEVLSKLHAQLAEQGTLLLVIPAGNNAAFFEAAQETFKKYQINPPWSQNDKKNDHKTMRTEAGCISCLKDAGFMPIFINALHTPTFFYNKRELVEWMRGTIIPNWNIPIKVAESFLNDLVDRMAELDSDVIQESGAYKMKLSRIEVIAIGV